MILNIFGFRHSKMIGITRKVRFRSLTRSFNKIGLSIKQKHYYSNGTPGSAIAYKLRHQKQVPPLPTIETSNWSVEGAVSSILYESPAPDTSSYFGHVLVCLVENDPGVLSRVSGTLAARGFNIDSLVVCSTEVKNLSRMTIVMQGQDGVVEQARRQVEDLVPVWAVLDYTKADTVKRELLLARVSLLGPEHFRELVDSHQNAIAEAQAHDPEIEAKYHVNDEHSEAEKYNPRNLPASEALRQRHAHLNAISNLAEQFHGKVLDISDRNCIVELSAKPSRISAFLKLLHPFGVLEVARSGMMALTRAQLESSEDEMPEQAVEQVDVTQLPPG